MGELPLASHHGDTGMWGQTVPDGRFNLQSITCIIFPQPKGSFLVLAQFSVAHPSCWMTPWFLSDAKRLG